MQLTVATYQSIEILYVTLHIFSKPGRFILIIKFLEIKDDVCERDSES